VIGGIRQDGIRDERSLFLFDRRISAVRDSRYRIVKHCPQESRVIGLAQVMAREFKTVRFFVMMAVAAFVVCGVTAFYTHRAAHGHTPEERSAYWIGERAGEQASREAKLPTAAELNMMAQNYFEQQGSGNKQDWDLAFEHGYEDGFKKTQSSQ
jgi:hypothetical protein